MTLYDIDNQIAQILNESVDEETGELNEEALESIGALQMARTEKLDNIGIYLKSLDAEITALKEEKSKLDERIKSKSNKIERIKNYLLTYVITEKKIETTHAVYTTRDSEYVDVISEEDIPEMYLKIKVEKSPDKTAIKNAIKAGEEIPGAVIAKRASLTIK